MKNVKGNKYDPDKLLADTLKTYRELKKQGRDTLAGRVLMLGVQIADLASFRNMLVNERKEKNG